jgi:hypothetical protein
MGWYGLAKLIDEVSKTLLIIYFGHPSVVCRPSWSRGKRHGYGDVDFAMSESRSQRAKRDKWGHQG